VHILSWLAVTNRGVEALKHLAHGVALAAMLAVGAPILAQAQTRLPATNAPAATPVPIAPQNATAAPTTPRPKRHVGRTSRYVQVYPRDRDYYGEEYYYERGPASFEDYGAADELNRRQLQGGGWYRGAAGYPYAPYTSSAPYTTPAPYMPAYPAPPPYYRRY
jgi:hypothetical protein